MRVNSCGKLHAPVSAKLHHRWMRTLSGTLRFPQISGGFSCVLGGLNPTRVLFFRWYSNVRFSSWHHVQKRLPTCPKKETTSAFIDELSTTLHMHTGTHTHHTHTHIGTLSLLTSSTWRVSQNEEAQNDELDQ